MQGLTFDDLGPGIDAIEYLSAAVGVFLAAAAGEVAGGKAYHQFLTRLGGFVSLEQDRVELGGDGHRSLAVFGGLFVVEVADDEDAPFKVDIDPAEAQGFVLAQAGEPGEGDESFPFDRGAGVE